MNYRCLLAILFVGDTHLIWVLLEIGTHRIPLPYSQAYRQKTTHNSHRLNSCWGKWNCDGSKRKLEANNYQRVFNSAVSPSPIACLPVWKRVCPEWFMGWSIIRKWRAILSFLCLFSLEVSTSFIWRCGMDIQWISFVLPSGSAFSKTIVKCNCEFCVKTRTAPTIKEWSVAN